MDPFPLKGIDHLHFYTGNAKQAAHFYRSAFGFRLAGYRGPETGVRELVSYLLEQGRVRFVLSTPLEPDHAIHDFLKRHGDGVCDIAIEVDDAEHAWRTACARGAESAKEPRLVTDEFGRLKFGSIRAYGDTLHTFVERREYGGGFWPGFQLVEGEDQVSRPVGLRHIDHIVGNVGWGEMNRWVEFYQQVMGFTVFQSFDDQDISTEYSALMSKVLSDGGGRIKFPINEPAEGRRRSQIEEYLEFNQGPGVQHVAMSTTDIIDTVKRLSQQGIEFLTVPTAYYRDLTSRVGPIAEPLEELERLGILVDRDDEGYLLQIFTKPVEDRPTLFFEIIQRKGSRSFGKGNFKALFEAIEREQALRGNL